MRALIARDLGDAQVDGLSADRRFATAYNAALQTANMAIACAGYRVSEAEEQRLLEACKLLNEPTRSMAKLTWDDVREIRARAQTREQKSTHRVAPPCERARRCPNAPERLKRFASVLRRDKCC